MNISEEAIAEAAGTFYAGAGGLSENGDMKIPEKAIEAATDMLPWQFADYLDTDTVRAALEAALPYLLEEARKGGLL